MVYEYLSVVHFTLVKRPYNSISVRQWLFLIEFHYICIVYFCQTCGIIFIQLFFFTFANRKATRIVWNNDQ